jgi:hypothetical protein
MIPPVQFSLNENAAPEFPGRAIFETTTGAKESLSISYMFAEVGFPLLAVMFLETSRHCPSIQPAARKARSGQCAFVPMV